MKKQHILSEARKCIARLGAAFVLVLAVCSTTQAQEVRTNGLPGTNFSKYRTYNWVKIGVVLHPDQILDAEIKQSIDSQLVGKGFTKADSDTPDLLVDYQILVSQERQWNATGMRDPIGLGMSTATSSTINIGTLVLNIYDPAVKQLVWKGFATKEINLSKDQQKNRRSLDKATRKLLKDFPPKRT